MADFEGAETFINNKLEAEMPKLEYHDIRHVRDVVRASVAIAAAEGLTEEETMLVRMAALLHDIGYIHSAKHHEQRGADMARELLPSFGFNPEQVETICKMIMATRAPQSPSGKLEKILCDADLDYLGREDFYEVGGRLFREMKKNGIVGTEQEWNLLQKKFLESHRYHTPYSQTNREPGKQERLQEIMAGLNSNY
ncbi:MAG TPA: HD domain-containing protein [Cyclobacteriaceae bacterium]|nr:HD domain-containing protein [Cyclobacteriaceae bacterium]